MRRLYGCVLIGCLGIGVPPAMAQTPEIQKEVEKKLDRARAEKTALEQLITEALKNNPDIRLAESKVREAEAELQRTRMKVLSDVTLAHIEIQAAQSEVDVASARYLQVQKLYETKSVSSRELAEAKQVLAKSKAALPVLQAKLPYLLGKASVTDSDMSVTLRLDAIRALSGMKTGTDEEFLRRLTLDVLGRLPTVQETKDFLKLPSKDRRKLFAEQLQKIQKSLAESFKAEDLKRQNLEAANHYVRNRAYENYLGAVAAAHRPASPLTEKLRKALDAPVRLQVSSCPPLEALEHVRDAMLDGLNLVVRVRPLKTDPLDIRFKAPIPAGAFLEYLEDELGVVFVLRDYGIVVVAADTPLPPGALRVVEFWKSGRAEQKESHSKEQK